MNLVKQIKDLEIEREIEKRNFSQYISEIRKALDIFEPYCNVVPFSKNELEDYKNILATEEYKNNTIYFDGYLYSQKGDSIYVIGYMKGILIAYEDRKKEHEKKMEEYTELIDNLYTHNDACFKCRGTGVIHKERYNSYCEREEIVCPECKGTGKIIRNGV